jgi:ketosteroid isomerase-like protein
MPRALVLAIAIAIAAPALCYAQTTPDTSPGILLEIRSYTLKPGERERFHDRFVRESLPLLHRWKVDVVAFGPSLHDRDSYVLMRAFQDIEARERQEEAFYASAEWRDGPREAVLAAIDSYTTIVIRVDAATLEGLRHAMPTSTTPADLEVLARLNREYIDAVKNSDVRRFSEILADDFLCSLPDGSIMTREQFLENAARPYGLVGLEAHDVNIRLMGDMALVHARTTFTLPGGTPGSGRYTDVWARRDGRWVAVAAHVTRR